MNQERIVDKEGVWTVSNEQGELTSIIRRDPTSKKHLIYSVKEMTCDDIGDLIKTNTDLKSKN